MSVSITTTFYDGLDYSNLYSVIFTSPNHGSPTNNTWRSHIIPGELPLATWYSGSSIMYRIFNSQVPSVESYAYNTTASGFHIRNSVKFGINTEVGGECYDCRLTAWDDFSHSTTNNTLINTNRVKASAFAYRWQGPDISPTSVVPILAPKYNFVMKGDTTTSGVTNYYGDFDMAYAFPTTSYEGDICIFRPYLDNVNSEITPDVYDYVTTLHYSYT